MPFDAELSLKQALQALEIEIQRTRNNRVKARSVMEAAFGVACTFLPVLAVGSPS